MEYKDIKRLLDAIAGADINEFTLETTEYKLAVRRGAAGVTVTESQAPAQLPQAPVQPATQIPQAVAALQEAPLVAAIDPHLIEITAPIVGTFYAAASPEAADYVKVGDKVSQGAVLCIIEAMKLMNEIEAEVSGVITEILVRNEEPVEYGQPLFRIRPS
jgi:acetyl-CoA carboxylase biotin carboxyl carrier protein